MLNNQRPNKPGQHDTSPVLKRVRKSVYKQAMLAGLLIVLTVVILFTMTAAWYTNIVQTNSLVFKASDWGFDGTVKSVDAAIVASPGDEGVIELTAVSESNDITAISANISKAQMPEEIQKRIYFYADTSKTRNNEAMERVYLGNDDSYTYTLFGKDTLVLSETVHTDVLLKWHWVYDVLGYYVQGTWDGTSMTVSEYLRPIEYDYDDAGTTFDAGGNLVTVDGTMTVAQFLSDLSAHDGYAGAIDTTKSCGGYYPVSVSGDSGVWVYLCSESEIQTNTNFDTELGSKVKADGTLVSYVAKLTLSAQNSYLEPTQVSTPAALATALSSGKEAVVQLSNDIALSDELVIGSTNSAQQVMLDLNGNTLTIESGSYSTSGAAIQVAAGSELTVTNGTIVCNKDSYAIDGTGADITLSGVKITDVKRALIVKDSSDSNTSSSDARIRLVNCELSTSDVSVMISGNGTDSDQATQLIVEDSKISSGYIGIAFNGSTDQWGTTTQIVNSQVYGYWTGIYHPQSDAEMTISGGSTISGYTGMVLKGGTTTVIDSTVTGIGDPGAAPTSLPLSGFNDTGDGIYVESNYGWEILLYVTNSTVTSAKQSALRVYPTESNVKINVSSGKFSSQITTGYLAANTFCGFDTSSGYYVVGAVATTQSTEG